MSKPTSSSPPLHSPSDKYAPISTADKSFKPIDSTLHQELLPVMENRSRSSSTSATETKTAALKSSPPMLSTRKSEDQSASEDLFVGSTGDEDAAISIASSAFGSEAADLPGEDIFQHNDQPIDPGRFTQTPRQMVLPMAEPLAKPAVLNLFIPLIDACLSGERKLVKAALKTTPKNQLNKMNEAGQTALTIAAAAGRTDLTKLLVAAGANINSIDASGMTALHHAVRQGRHDTVKWLLGHKAKMINEGAGLPLYVAIRSGEDKMIQLLLKANKHFSVHEFMTDAIVNNDLNSIRAMLRNGLAAKPESIGGLPPLMQALALGRGEAALLLLDNGAEVNQVIKNSFGETESPLSVAIKSAVPGEVILKLLSAMKPKIIIRPDLVRQLFKRASEEKDYRILNEMAVKTFIDADGRAFDPAQI